MMEEDSTQLVHIYLVASITAAAPCARIPIMFSDSKCSGKAYRPICDLKVLNTVVAVKIWAPNLAK